MATPLHELVFHEGPSPIKQSYDDDKVDDDIMSMGNYLQEQYGFAYTSILPKSVEFSASSLIPLFLTGKSNNIPNLVSILWDIYCQWKLLNIWKAKENPDSLSTPKNFSFEYFLLCSPLGENMNFSGKNIKLLTRGMNEYYFNYFWPISRSTLALINDSFQSYTKYTISISQSVNSIISKNSDLFPLHLDFWIIPKSVVVKVQTEQDISYIDQQDFVLMNIEKRLKLGNIPFIKQMIKNEKDMSSIGISQLLSRKIIEALNIKREENNDKNSKNKKSHRRMITIIDRRATYYDFIEHKSEEKETLKRNDPPLIEIDRKNTCRNVGDGIYIYPVNNHYGEIPENYIQEKLLFNTQQWLLPFCRIKNDDSKTELDGGTDFNWKHQVFVISFHINSAKDVKAYWYLNGDMMRFVPNNMKDIWPNYFYKDKDGKMEKEIEELDYKRIQKEWKLKITDEAYEQYYRELIPSKK